MPEWSSKVLDKLRPGDWTVMANIVTTLKVRWWLLNNCMFYMHVFLEAPNNAPFYRGTPLSEILPLSCSFLPIFKCINSVLWFSFCLLIYSFHFDWKCSVGTKEWYCCIRNLGHYHTPPFRLIMVDILTHWYKRYFLMCWTKIRIQISMPSNEDFFTFIHSHSNININVSFNCICKTFMIL